MWPNFERQQAIERLIEQRGSSYILPVRLNGFTGDVPGLSRNIAFLPINSNNPDKVVSAFLQKIGKIHEGDLGISEKTKPSPKYIPKIRKKFTDKEKNQFLKNSFERIVGLIDEFSRATNKEYPQIEYEIERVSTRKATFTLYDSGMEITHFKVWVSSSLGTDSIMFRYGRGIEDDNSFNESFSILEAEGELRLEPLGMLTLGIKRDKSMSPEQVAEHLWKIVCKNFQ